MKSPRTLTINELDPASVDHYKVRVLLASDGSQLASTDYPIAGAVTVIPVGSDASLASVAAGTVVNFEVTEVAPGGELGPAQVVPGGPYTVVELPDGAESLTVQL